MLDARGWFHDEILVTLDDGSQFLLTLTRVRDKREVDDLEVEADAPQTAER